MNKYSDIMHFQKATSWWDALGIRAFWSLHPITSIKDGGHIEQM